MGDCLVVVVGFWASRILQIPLFRNPKERRQLLRVPQFGPQNPAMGLLKSQETPFRACVRRRSGGIPLLASILRS